MNDHFEQIKASVERRLARLLKAAQIRSEQAQLRLDECLQWEKVQHEGLLLQAHFHLLKRGMHEITVPDWENNGKDRKVSLDPQLEPKTEIARRFQKSRKLQRGIPHQKKQLDKTLLEENRLSRNLQSLSKVTTLEELEQWRDETGFIINPSVKKPSTPLPKRPYREFRSQSGLKIWVGKNAKDNDKLSFHLANGSDWWLHARDVSGSHVVIRVEKGSEPDPGCLQDAIQLALHYSKAKGEGDVCITQCKYLAKIKGRPGAVSVSKQRTVYGRVDPERFQQIRERKGEG